MFPEYSRNRLAAWLRAGRITVAGAAATPKVKVWGGEAVTLDAAPDPQAMAFQPQDIPLAIVFEDEHLIVINKPPGLVVHPGSGNWDGTMLNALLQHAPPLAQLPRAGIVHRSTRTPAACWWWRKHCPRKPRWCASCRNTV
jgi:23S rRNA pseudouridine1911/1915/1917 synthase